MTLTDTETGSPATKGDDYRIDTPSDAYERMEKRRRKCRDLMEGTEAIRRNADRYLPQMEGESDDAWTTRISLGALFNGFERTVLASVGMLSVRDPILTQKMPPDLRVLADDVDGMGTALPVFASQLMQDAIIDGHAGIFVDMPATQPGKRIDAATAIARGLRPYFILVNADDEWLPFYGVVNGRKQLAMLVRRVRKSERVGDFGLADVVEFWLYVLAPTGVEYAKYVSRDGLQAQLDPEYVGGRKVMRISRIPYARCVVGQALSDVETKPTLETLADLNLEHHRTKNGILNLEELAFTPTQVRIGAPVDADGNYPAITLGPRNVIEAPLIQGVPRPVYWHQPDVSVIDPAMKTLDKTELAMEVSGSAFLSSQTRAQETAAAKKLNAKAQNATLARAAQAEEDCVQNAFSFAGEFMGLTVPIGTVEVSREFDESEMDAQTMVAYVNAVANAGLPPRILLQEWQKRGRISPDENIDDLEADMLAAKDASDQAKAMDAALQRAQLQGDGANADPNSDPTQDGAV